MLAIRLHVLRWLLCFAAVEFRDDLGTNTVELLLRENTQQAPGEV